MRARAEFNQQDIGSVVRILTRKEWCLPACLARRHDCSCRGRASRGFKWIHDTAPVEGARDMDLNGYMILLVRTTGGETKLFGKVLSLLSPCIFYHLSLVDTKINRRVDTR